MEFFPFFFMVIISIVIFAVVKSSKQRRSRFEGIAVSLGLNFQGAGTGVIRLYGVKSDRRVFCMLQPQGKNTPAFLDILIETNLPYTLGLKRQSAFTGFKTRIGVARDLEVGDKSLDDAFEINADECPEAARILRHPVIRHILLGIAERPFQHLELENLGMKYREKINDKTITAEEIRQVLQLVLQLSIYLARPNHLESVASPEETLRELSSVIDGHARESTIETEQRAEAPVSEAIVQTNEPEETEMSERPVTLAEEVGREEPAVQEESEAQAEQPTAGEATPAPATPPEVGPAGVLKGVADGTSSPEEAARSIAAGGTEWIDQTVASLGEYQLRKAALSVIPSLGPQAVPSLVKRLGDFRLSYEIKNVLKQLDAESAGELLLELNRTEDRDTINAVLEAIGELKPEGAIQKVGEFVRSQDFNIRFQAERTLRSLGLGYAEIESLKKEAT